MEKKVMEIKVNEGELEYLEARYHEYRAKQDIINSIMEIHVFDDDATIINSEPFKAYEKAFAEAKYMYDHTMEEIQNKYIPEEVRNAGCKWEAKFNEAKIVVTPIA